MTDEPKLHQNGSVHISLGMECGSCWERNEDGAKTGARQPLLLDYSESAGCGPCEPDIVSCPQCGFYVRFASFDDTKTLDMLDEENPSEDEWDYRPLSAKQAENFSRLHLLLNTNSIWKGPLILIEQNAEVSEPIDWEAV